MVRKEYFAVYAPNGDLCSRVEATKNPQGEFGHLYSSITAWAEAGRDYTGTPEGIHRSVLVKVGYKGVIEVEAA